MNNGKNIHPDFTDELQQEGESFGFIYEQVEEGIKYCGFSPHDAEFAMYIGDNIEEEEGAISEMQKEKLDKLREEYNKEVKKEVKNLSLKRKNEEITDPSDQNWRNIHPNFTPELVQEGQGYGLSYEMTSDWIRTGIGIVDAKFCAGLRDIKKVNAEGVLNHGNIEQLQSEYQQYLLINHQIQLG